MVNLGLSIASSSDLGLLVLGSALDDDFTEHATRHVVHQMAVKSLLSGGVHLGFGIDRGAGRNADRVLDRVPFLGTCIQDGSHTMLMHRVSHHGFVDEFEPHTLAILESDGLSLLIFLVIYRPDISLHIAGQAQRNFSGWLAHLIKRFLRL